MPRELKKLGEEYHKLQEVINKKKNSQEPYEINIVTPMFGGSSQPGEVNKDFPVRSSAIRGHLRFWWRATRGAIFKSAYELRKREVKIFGDTDTPSSIKVWVERMTPSIHLKEAMGYGEKKKADKPPSFEFVNNLPPYVAFPFDYKRNRKMPILFGSNYKFKLHIYVENSSQDEAGQEELQREIDAAMWGWINFGGLGARTRRGCGSLYCAKFSPPSEIESNQNIFEWYEKCQRDYDLELPLLGDHREWPTLCRNIRVEPYIRTLSAAWITVIKTYKKFRRAPDHFKKRSHWPEPDSIRRMTGMYGFKHEKSVTLPENGDIAFPRAQFGLPIQFQFKSDNQNEPYKTQLVSNKGDRLASPLILKAIAVSAADGYSVIAILNQPPIQSLKLQIVKENIMKPLKTPDEVESLLAKREIKYKEIYISPRYLDEHRHKNPMRIKSVFPHRATSSAIEAFLESDEVNKWKPSNQHK